MTQFLLRIAGAAVVYGSLVATIPVRAEDRSPDAILKEIDAVKEPTLDAKKEAAYWRAVVAMRVARRRGEDEGRRRVHRLRPQ